MAFDNDYAIMEDSAYNEEYFYALQDEYEEYRSIEEEEPSDAEYNCIEIARMINMLKKIGPETGIAYKYAVGALTMFLDEYEKTL